MKDRIGRILMVLASIGAIGAFASGVVAMQASGSDRLWIEAWRTFGFLVFAGLFLLLAFRPRTSPAIWELVFAHKLAMVIFGLEVGAISEAALAGKVDFFLVLMIVTAWWLCQGWQSWRREA